MSSDIKFSRLLGVCRDQHNGRMQLPLTDNVINHIGSMHASAQFALAEIGSGDFLRQRFPDLQGKVQAVVRRAEIKYSKPVNSSLVAFPYLEDDNGEALQLDNKGRALVSVHVKLETETGEVATHAIYHWFITKL